ncbi:MAG: hypothetical protein KGM43_18270 [Planctomycetota bacterium]|nr:hypothetical protein [Planctomycetota bacterium]
MNWMLAFACELKYASPLALMHAIPEAPGHHPPPLRSTFPTPPSLRNPRAALAGLLTLKFRLHTATLPGR